LKAKASGYWTSTAILVLALLLGGGAQLVRQKQFVEGILRLGYPVYMNTILGFWKVAGAAALVVPKFPRLKEWAYAGVFFEMTGAAFSHAACGDPAWHVAVTLGFTVLTVISWALRPETRIAGVLFPWRLRS